MLQHKKWFILLFVILSLTFVFADENTQKSEHHKKISTTSAIKNPADFEILFENNDFVFSFKDDRDVLNIYDKRNGYTWKSGLDIASSKEIKAALRKGNPLGFEPIEEKMNEIFTSLANSFITVEYYDDSLGIKRVSSDVFSELKKVDDENNHFVLDIQFEEIDLQLMVHLLFTDAGYDIQLKDIDITGSDKNILAAVLLNPFMGSSGGMHALYNSETGKHDDPIKKPEIPGYVFVPDGPGALIQFDDYNVSMKPYKSRVYGENLSKETYHNIETYEAYVPLKKQLMPVYGIAHTNSNAAFVGYASGGDPFMDIVVMPEENTTLYTFAYPRFEYNSTYYQVFNKRGDGYFSLYETNNVFDINFHYAFLTNSENETADYAGMAKKYRDYLQKNDLLPEASNPKDVSIRVDFIMSDEKKSVIGYENSVVTTAKNVEDILTDLHASGVKNISSGLLGFQDGGFTNGQPWDTDWSNKIGSKKDFERMISTVNGLGIDVSMSQDYLNINKDQVKVTGNAVKHINNWYLEKTLFSDVPFDTFYYAKPAVSVDWLKEQIKALKKIDIKSHTISGITSSLITEHGHETMLEDDVILLLQETLSDIHKETQLNLVTPNQYLWAYTDCFLQTPVFSSQYLIETETVPFLSMVLNGSMSTYAPYSNFSFSDQKSILKMIDYNVFPSFILSKEPSYLLSATNSLNLYSTEYDLYKNTIIQVYNQIKNTLSVVQGTTWINREMLEPDVFLNTYENGVHILINYQEETVEYKGQRIEPLSYQIFYLEDGHEEQ